jgi:drug/metabolite transporter (DMT)-like permease
MLSAGAVKSLKPEYVSVAAIVSIVQTCGHSQPVTRVRSSPGWNGILVGYILVLCSLFSYGALGICHKLAERKHCRPKQLVMRLMLSAFLSMNVFVIFGRQGYATTHSAFYVAFTCGAISLCALWAFQEGIKRGKIATSWLIINLSSVVPTLGSIVIYHEAVSLKKIAIIGLIFAAIVLVWKDGLEDLKRAEDELRGSGGSHTAASAGEATEKEEV